MGYRTVRKKRRRLPSRKHVVPAFRVYLRNGKLVRTVVWVNPNKP